MGDRDSTWFARVLSWTSVGRSREVSLQVDETSVPTFSLNNYEVDFDTKYSSTLRRKPVIRGRRSQSRLKTSSSLRPSALLDERSRVASVYPCSIVYTIFELYHPWKVKNLESQLGTLSPSTQTIFKAALSGDVDVIQVQLSTQEYSNVNILNAEDNEGRSPIHFACAVGNISVVELLLSKGANPNALDSSKCITPLICAAVNGNERVMDALIDIGADINFGLECPDLTIRNSESEYELHTALVWAVKARNYNSVKYLLSKGALLSGTTVNWETPVHEACSLGHYEILKLLINHDPNIQSLELCVGSTKNTALHIAVQDGHRECIDLLLNAGANPNKENSEGQTALHYASSEKDSDAMQLLLKAGAEVNARNNKKRTPLHYCVLDANRSDKLETAQCLELLLSNGADVDIQDEFGATAFHLAVDNGNSNIVARFLHHGADLTLSNTADKKTGLEVLVKKMPHAIRYVKESLDKAISLKRKETSDPECTLSLNFRAIVTNTDWKTLRKETELLMSFCSTGHKEILSHPVIEAFLILKWDRVKKYFWASFAANLVMVITYSMHTVYVYSHLQCPIGLPSVPSQEFDNSTIQNGNSTNEHPTNLQEIVDACFIIWILLIIMISVFTIKEILQFIPSPCAYFRHAENYIQIIFIVTSIITTILPFAKSQYPLQRDDLCRNLDIWHHSMAAFGILIAWFLILLRMGKLPGGLGLYVQMLFKVVTNFSLVMFAYASIIIAFVLCFRILLKDFPEFTDEVIALQTTLVMMTGEIDMKYVLPLSENKACLGKGPTWKEPVPFVTNLIFGTFVLLVTVVLMNLLVGLAVSDIQGLREGAKVARLSRLVVAISQLESMFFSKRLINILPKTWIWRLRKDALFVQNDNMYTFDFRPYHPLDKKLPQSLQTDALHILEKREKEKLHHVKKCSQSNPDFEQDVLDAIGSMEHALQKYSLAIINIQNMLNLAEMHEKQLNL